MSVWPLTHSGGAKPTGRARVGRCGGWSVTGVDARGTTGYTDARPVQSCPRSALQIVADRGCTCQACRYCWPPDRLYAAVPGVGVRHTAGRRRIARRFSFATPLHGSAHRDPHRRRPIQRRAVSVERRPVHRRVAGAGSASWCVRRRHDRGRRHDRLGLGSGREDDRSGSGSAAWCSTCRPWCGRVHPRTPTRA